jgi:tetratricopeptide (TPR) repeat protein
MPTGQRTIAIAAAVFVTALTAAAQTPRRNIPPPAAPPNAQPAVLVLRVTDAPGPAGPLHRLDVVQPRGWTKLPLASDEQPEFTEDGAPRMGAGCELARTVTLGPGSPDIRYYVYNLDLNDPQVASRWREFQQAQRSEQRLARAEARSYHEWEQRKQKLLAVHEQTTQEGVELLKAGAYREALITLTRAAELNNGDPVCRIHLAQTRVALGHDTEGGKVLRRALELQPKLVPMLLGLEQYYPSNEDFTIQVDTLAQRLNQRRDATPDEYLLLGFMEFQRGWMDEAYAAFRLAARGRPKDTLVQSYLDLTKPAQTNISTSRPSASK